MRQSHPELNFRLGRGRIRERRKAFSRDSLAAALPLATFEEDFKLVRSIAEAIGEISPDEGITALRRELQARREDTP